MTGIQQQATAVNATDTYATLLKARTIDLEYATVTIENTDDANGITIQILVTNDPTGAAGWAALELNSAGDTELALEANTAEAFELSGFAWVDIQQKNTVAEAVGVGNAYLLGH